MKTNNSIEIMAPAGGFDSMQALNDNGANSFYFGVDLINMRARATMNFTLEDLKKIEKPCKEKVEYWMVELSKV